MMLLDQEDLRLNIREKLRSREWWMFVPAPGSATDFMNVLEKKFYRGQKNEDFIMIFGPYLAGMEALAPFMLAIFLARKTHMPPSKLARMFQRVGMAEDEETLAVRDVLCLWPSKEAAAVIAYGLNEWIKDRDGEEPVNP